MFDVLERADRRDDLLLDLRLACFFVLHRPRQPINRKTISSIEYRRAMLDHGRGTTHQPLLPVLLTHARPPLAGQLLPSFADDLVEKSGVLVELADT